MANYFKDWIFNQLPRFHKVNDTLRDKNGDGLLKRYLRSMGMELDENFLPYIDNFTNLIDILKINDKHLPALGGILGYPPSINDDNNTYRKILAYAVAIYKIKGTLQSFQILFNLLGLEIKIFEETPKKKITYDIPVLYDKDNTYDQDCDHCSGYWIEFNSVQDPCNGPFNEVDWDAFPTLSYINNIICFLNPINAVFKGLIRNYKLCDTIALDPSDFTNFCPRPNPTVEWSVEDNVGYLHVPGVSSYVYRYRVFPSGDFAEFGGGHGTSIPTVQLTGANTANTIYEIQVANVCDDSHVSAYTTIYMLAGSGIVNGTGRDILPSAISYVKPFLAKLLTNYYLDFAFPSQVIFIRIDGINISYVGEDFANAGEMVTWLNSLNKGVWDHTGDRIFSLDNPNTVDKIQYFQDDQFVEIPFIQEGQYFTDTTAKVQTDYVWEPDFTDTLNIIKVVINRLDVAGPGSPIANTDDLITWLNSLGKGGWGPFETTKVRSQGNQNAWGEITYTLGEDPTENKRVFAISNIASSDNTLAIIQSDYQINIDFTEGIFLKRLEYIHNGSYDHTNGPGTLFMNAFDLVTWLNGQNKGLFITVGDDIVSLNNPNTIRSIVYFTPSDSSDHEVTFEQRNVKVVNPTPLGQTIVFGPGFTIHNAEVFVHLIDPGPYSSITLFIPIETNPIPIAGGTLITDGSGPYIGFMDGTNLKFMDVVLGNNFEILTS